MSQRLKYTINYVFWNLILTTISGTILQTFLLEKGTGKEDVSLFLTIMQFTQLIVIFGFSRLVDYINNIIRTTALVFLLYIPFVGTMLYFCFTADSNYLLLIGLGIVANAAVGFYNVLGYKIPYHIMDIKDYGKWTGAAGIPAGVFMLVFSLAVTYVQAKVGYFPAMRIIYAISLVCITIYVILTLSYKKVDTNHVDAPKEKINILRYKPFTILILPNLLRGFCAGILGMATVIGYSTNQINDSSAMIILTVTQLVTILASLLYTVLVGKELWMLLISSIVAVISLPLMIANNTTWFIVFFGIAYFAISIINITVPVQVTKIIDYEIAGQYSGWRMLLNTLGILIANAVCVVLMEAISPLFVLIIAGVSQLISGFVYWIYCTKLKNSIVKSTQ